MKLPIRIIFMAMSILLTGQFDLYSQNTHYPPISCSGLSGLTTTEYQNLPLMEVRLNFHFVANSAGENFTTTEALAMANGIVDAANNRLSNLQAANMPGPNGQSVTHVPDARFRFTLYGDPSNLNQAIWLWPNQSSVQYEYGNFVMNVLVIETNSTGISGQGGNGMIQLENVYSFRNEPWIHTSASGVSTHEFFHVLGLDHT